MNEQSLHHLAPFCKVKDLPRQRLTTYDLQMETTWAQHWNLRYTYLHFSSMLHWTNRVQICPHFKQMRFSIIFLRKATTALA